MTQPPISDDILADTVKAYRAAGSQAATAVALGIARSTLQNRLQRAAERGLMGFAPVLPGFKVAKVSNGPNGDYIQQKPDLGAPYQAIDSLALKGRTTWAEVRPDGSRVATREVLMERADAGVQRASFEAMVAALKDDLPRLDPAPAPSHAYTDLLNSYVVTDSHFGMLAWHEETGSDYDLAIAEKLLLDWFAAAIDISPNAHTGVLAQLGDLMHHDSLDSVTPAHRHVLDSDSRLQKVIRVVIRTVRRIIDMLLCKHEHVHVIMASGNHDPASSAWLREMLAAMYENEPRITVDNSPSHYYALEWGKTALFWHHGDKRGIANVDVTFAGMFRELYGRSTHAFAHVGHLHSDEGKKGGLMYVERHETLAARDAYASAGGWLSGRSAKVITYTKRGGEVFRSTLRPEMVEGWAAANDNVPAQGRAAA